MSNPTYSAVIYVQNDSDFSFPAAVEACRSSKGLSASRIEATSDKGIEIYFDDWCLRVGLEDEPFVAEENREFAEASPEYPHAQEIALCQRRISVWSREADPNMDHFNDYLLTVETLIKPFRGLIAIDKASDEPM